MKKWPHKNKERSKHGNIFNSKSPDIDLKEVLQRKEIVYIILPSLNKKESRGININPLPWINKYINQNKSL